MNLIVMGVTGAGKTTVGLTLAGLLGRRYIEGDAFHPDANRKKMASGVALDDEDRWPWLDSLVSELDARDEPVVLSCSALKVRYRDRLRRSKAPLHFVWLHGTRELIGGRLNDRKDHYMPASLLASQFAALEPPLPAETVLEVEVDKPAQAIAKQIIEALHLDRVDL